MSPWLVGLAVAAVVGGIAAVSAREPRTAVVGLALVAIATPLIVDPFPQPLPLAARLVAAILAGYLLWAALVPYGPQAISVTERLTSRQLGPQGRELVANADNLRKQRERAS